MSTASPEEFCTLLHRTRTAAGLSQEMLAERAGVSVDAISALERGRRRAPQRETVVRLVEALGASPSTRGDFMAAAKRARRRGFPAHEPLHPNNLPAQATSFLGRERELGEIEGLLRRERLATLLGPGGIGKTRTALEAGRRALAGFPDGVWFVDLSAVADADLVPATLAAALDLKLPASLERTAALVSVLCAKRLLLILDNCEHVAAGAGALTRALLEGCPDVNVLATSRQALDLEGENVYALPALSLPNATALFAERALAVNPRFALREHDGAAVVDICRGLDGSPLAIELAAARAPFLGVAHLRERLDQRLRLLTRGARGAPNRQQSLRAAVDWSYELLDEREQHVFRKLGVFAGGFTVAAAVAIAATPLDEFDTIEILDSLSDKSLIVAEHRAEATRLGLLETLRLYALEKLSAAGELDETRDRHLRYFGAAVLEAASERSETGSFDAFDALAPDAQNVRGAFAWSLAGGDVAFGALIAAKGKNLFLRAGWEAEGADLARRFLAVETRIDPGVAALLGANRSVLLTSLGRTSEAIDVARDAVRLARRSDSQSVLSRCLSNYARFAAMAGRFDEAKVALAEADRVADASPIERLLVMDARGAVLHMNGEFEAALPVRRAYLELARSLNVEDEITATMNLSELEHARGNTETAIELARDMLARNDEFVASLPPKRERLLFGRLYTNLAGYLVALGRTEAAVEAGLRTLKLYGDTGLERGDTLFALLHLALGFGMQGDLARAARLFAYYRAEVARLGLSQDWTERRNADALTRLLDGGLTEDERAQALAAGARSTYAEARATAGG